MAPRPGVITGGIFVVCLTLLLFLFNGDLDALSLLSSGLTQYKSYVAQSLAYLVILGFGAIAMKSEGLTFASIGASKRNLAASFPILVALAAGTIGISLANGNISSALARLQSGQSPLVLLGSICFASFVEEYIFRGYVQNGTTKHFGVLAGILVSASVFSLAHVPTDLSGLSLASGVSGVLPFLTYSAVGRFFFGVVAFSTLYYLTGNFFLTLFTHAFYDISVFFLAPPDGSLEYRTIFIVIPYLLVFTFSGRFGFPPMLVGAGSKAGALPVSSHVVAKVDPPFRLTPMSRSSGHPDASVVAPDGGRLSVPDGRGKARLRPSRVLGVLRLDGLKS